MRLKLHLSAIERLVFPSVAGSSCAACASAEARPLCAGRAAGGGARLSRAAQPGPPLAWAQAQRVCSPPGAQRQLAGLLRLFQPRSRHSVHSLLLRPAAPARGARRALQRSRASLRGGERSGGTCGSSSCLISAENPPMLGNGACRLGWLRHWLDTNKKNLLIVQVTGAFPPCSFQFCQSHCSKRFSGVTNKLMTIHNNRLCLFHFSREILEPNPSCYM